MNQTMTELPAPLHCEILPGPAGRPPIILLHGWGHHLGFVKPLGELLNDVTPVHLVDLPGFGQSPAPPTAWGTADYADRMLRYLDDNGISKAVFIGHSFGGKTSLKLASAHPERVERLVLINSSGLRRRPGFVKSAKIRYVKTLRWTLRFLQNRLGIRWYDSWFIPRFASPDYKNAGPMRATFVRVVNEHLDADIENIATPALLLWGENDEETPLEAGQRMAAMIRGSELVVLESQGHLPFAGAGAAVCAYHIKHFLKREQRA